MPLSFATLRMVNSTRAPRWHGDGGINAWSPADWAVAVNGEFGEACNAMKKMKRIEDKIANISEAKRQLSTIAEARAKIGEELADTMIYLDLLAQRLTINLEEEVIKKFNKTSIEYGFPERL